MRNRVAALAAGLTLLASAQAAPVTFDLDGALGDAGLFANNSWDFATFTGSVTFDSTPTGFTSGVASFNTLQSWFITFTAIDGSTVVFDSDGEALDSGSFYVEGGVVDQVGLVIFEDIDDPATATSERRQFQMNFSNPGMPGGPLINTFDLLVASDPNFGAPGKLASGLLQFTTSQVPSVFARGSMTGAPSSEVPVPAALPLAAAGFGAMFGLSRRRRAEKRASGGR